MGAYDGFCMIEISKQPGALHATNPHSDPRTREYTSDLSHSLPMFHCNEQDSIHFHVDSARVLYCNLNMKDFIVARRSRVESILGRESWWQEL